MAWAGEYEKRRELEMMGIGIGKGSGSGCEKRDALLLATTFTAKRPGALPSAWMRQCVLD
jgi:hypothetical protein